MLFDLISYSCHSPGLARGTPLPVCGGSQDWIRELQKPTKPSAGAKLYFCYPDCTRATAQHQRTAPTSPSKALHAPRIILHLHTLLFPPFPGRSCSWLYSLFLL